MKIVSVVGARPQFIKTAPLARELRRAHHEVLVHTGQHYDDAMSAVFFRELDLPDPDYHLGVGSGSHGWQTGEMLKAVEGVLEQERPDLLLVYGDTNSTLAGALAAAKLHVPVAHVEAGLRSDNRAMPEEVNRVLTDHVSTLLFCPTPSSVANLAREGIVDGVHHVGDVMHDALLHFLPLAESRSAILDDLGLDPRGYLLLTLHRAENVDHEARLASLMAAVGRVDLPVVFPAHPRTRNRLEAAGLLGKLGPHVRVVPPVGYLDMLRLESQALAILTDSGGVQREAYFLSVPSVILRAETEWTELVEEGASRLAGEDLEEIDVGRLRAAPRVPPSAAFGGGAASSRIARVLDSALPDIDRQVGPSSRGVS